MIASLSFSVDGIRGALPLDDTMFLVRMVELTSLPDDRFGVIGGINLHGSIIPVYSFRRLFGLPDRPPLITDYLIVTRTGLSEVALWVDETFVVQDGEVLPDISTIPANGQPCTPGLLILPDGLVIIHDLRLFLGHEKTSDSVSVSAHIKEKYPTTTSEVNHSVGTDFQDPDHIRFILSERAKELAKPEEKPQEVSSIEVLKFQLLYHEYAVELKLVRESVLSREITQVPGTPEYVIGVLPVRGEIIPLIDLRVLLKIPDTGLTDLNQVIILTDGIITFGILADQITGIIAIPRDQISPVNPDQARGKPEYILGIGINDLVIINAAKILADSDMIVDDSGEHLVKSASYS